MQIWRFEMRREEERKGNAGRDKAEEEKIGRKVKTGRI